MKSVIAWTAAGLLLYLALLIAKLPAIQVLGRMPLEGINLQGVQGTIWQGTAHSLGVQGWRVNQLTWQLEFWPLLLGDIAVTLDAGNPREADEIAVNGPIRLKMTDPSQIHVHDLQLFMPAKQLLAQLPLPVPVTASGRLRVDIKQLDYQQSCQQLSATGHWLNASVDLPSGSTDLGRFDAQGECQNGNLQLTISEPNAFGLNATATLSQQGNFAIEGRFKPAPNLPDEIKQGAQFFGQPDAQGYYQVKF